MLLCAHLVVRIHHWGLLGREDPADLGAQPDSVGIPHSHSDRFVARRCDGYPLQLAHSLQAIHRCRLFRVVPQAQGDIVASLARIDTTQGGLRTPPSDASVGIYSQRGSLGAAMVGFVTAGRPLARSTPNQSPRGTL